MFTRIGYHGTTQANKAIILESNQPIVSQNDYDWLGTGFYLWEGDHERALDFAKLKISLAKTKDQQFSGVPAVVGVVYNEGNCLDFSKYTASRELILVYEILKNMLKEEGETLPANNSDPKRYWDKKLNNSVIEFLHSMRKGQGLSPYHCVKGYFKEGKEILPFGGITHQDHIQICIRPAFIKSSIIGYFDPLIDK